MALDAVVDVIKRTDEEGRKDSNIDYELEPIDEKE